MYTCVIFADSIGTVLSTINDVVAKNDNKKRVVSRGASLEVILPSPQRMPTHKLNTAMGH
jgi:hypothetical protein